MRFSTVWLVLGVCGLLAGTGCATMKEAEKKAEAGLKDVKIEDIKKDIAEVKGEKGDAKKPDAAAHKDEGAHKGDAHKADAAASGDGALTGHVKTGLAGNAKTKTHGFNVEVKGGVATLTGSGPADAKAEAEKVAKGISGVTSVENHITVKK